MKVSQGLISESGWGAEAQTGVVGEFSSDGELFTLAYVLLKMQFKMLVNSEIVLTSVDWYV